LAQHLGIDGKRLRATLTDYNRALETNVTHLFPVPRTGKPKILRAPFYGLRVVPGITFTMGGILINGRGQALNESDMPIAGLYAAGDAIGGLMGGYHGGYTGGLMQALVTGILAGENAAGQ
jgi:fumarate reductase flavoprotein subunit